jgi:TetR/AcrR family transcriptional repressor of nem operon
MARPREFDEDSVLDAIMETFWRNGYEGTSTQDLVDATGLGRGSLYAAYRDKKGLFEQALVRYRTQAQANAEQIRRPGSPVRRIREFLQSIVDADLKSSEKRGCLATNTAIEMAGRDPRVAELVRQNFRVLIDSIEDVIMRGQALGEIRNSTDAGTLALFVFSTVQGLRVLARTATSNERKKLLALIDQTMFTLE